LHHVTLTNLSVRKKFILTFCTYVLMSEIVKAEVNAALARKFRRKIGEVYGYKKGSVKIALEDLIKRFVSAKGTEWGSMKGVLKLEVGSVELQHRAWKRSD